MYLQIQQNAVMEIVKIECQRLNLNFGVTVESIFILKLRTITFAFSLNIYNVLISVLSMTNRSSRTSLMKNEYYFASHSLSGGNSVRDI